MLNKGKSRRGEEKHIEKKYCKPAVLVLVMAFSSDDPRLSKSNGV